MKKIKKLLGLLMACTILGTSVFTPEIAKASVKTDVQTKNIAVVNSLKTNSNAIKVISYKSSDQLTLDQLINEYAKDQKVSINKAKKALGVENTIDAKARGEFYRSYAITIDAGANSYSKYYPSIKFYCKTSEWDQYRGIEKILNSSLIRTDYLGTIKGFSGTLYTNLENAYTIHYELNGDFLNTATTTSTGGISIGIGEGSTITYSCSSSSNEYSYIYKESDYDPFNY